MSRKGNCWDARAESFFATLKTECVYPRRFATRAEPRETILEFIDGLAFASACVDECAEVCVLWGDEEAHDKTRKATKSSAT